MNYLLDREIDRLRAELTALHDTGQPTAVTMSSITSRPESTKRQVPPIAELCKILDDAIFEMHCCSRIFELLFSLQIDSQNEFVRRATHYIESLVRDLQCNWESSASIYVLSQTVDSRLEQFYDSIDEVLRSHMSRAKKSFLDSNLQASSMKTTIELNSGLQRLLELKCEFHRNEADVWQQRIQQAGSDSDLAQLCQQRFAQHARLSQQGAKALSFQMALNAWFVKPSQY